MTRLSHSKKQAVQPVACNDLRLADNRKASSCTLATTRGYVSLPLVTSRYACRYARRFGDHVPLTVHRNGASQCDGREP